MTTNFSFPTLSQLETLIKNEGLVYTAAARTLPMTEQRAHAVETLQASGIVDVVLPPPFGPSSRLTAVR